MEIAIVGHDGVSFNDTESVSPTNHPESSLTEIVIDTLQVDDTRDGSATKPLFESLVEWVYTFWK